MHLYSFNLKSSGGEKVHLQTHYLKMDDYIAMFNTTFYYYIAMFNTTFYYYIAMFNTTFYEHCFLLTTFPITYKQFRFQGKIHETVV